MSLRVLLPKNKSYQAVLRRRRRSDDLAIGDIAKRQLVGSLKKDWIHRILRSRSREMTVCQISQEPTGFLRGPICLGFMTTYAIPSKNVTVIEMIATHPEWTRLGVASLLLDRAMFESVKIQAFVSEDNYEGQGFFKSHGFSKFSENGMWCWEWKKPQ